MAPESTNASYTPGSWVAVGAESGWLLLDIDPSDQMVLQCWSLLRGGSQIDEVLDAVLQRGLRAVSSFAFVRLAGDGRRAVVVRGAARAAITVDGADQAVSAEGVSTWRELELPARTSAVRISTGEDTGRDDVPLAPGVTLAASIRLAVPAAAPTAVEAPAPQAAHLNGDPLTAPIAQLSPTPVPPLAERVPEAEFTPAMAQRPEASAPTQAEPDATSRMATVKSLPPATEGLLGAAGNPPPAPVEAPVPGFALSGRGGGQETPPPQSPPAPSDTSQPWAQPPPGATDTADATATRVLLNGVLGQQSQPGQPGPSGSLVQAVRCQHGHLSPPMAVSCRVCGFPLMGQAPISVPRPMLGVLRLSTGDVVPLDRSVIMGRNPRVEDAAEADRPHIVRLPSPGHDISRTHVEIRLDGWHVLLTDLNSVNGTIVTPPWQEPQRLRPNESVPIEPGTVVSLADEVTFRYEVTA
jgi:hypothetical protein